MFEKKAPIWNGVAALGNLAEALFWFGITTQAPRGENLQAMYESLVTAGENILLCAMPYFHKADSRNEAGAIYNGIFSGAHYSYSYMLEHFPYITEMVYPPRSLSRVAQPLVALVGTGLNISEGYKKK